MIKNRRCRKCNWLNLEVTEKFNCKNCGQSNDGEAVENVIEETKTKINWIKEVDDIKGIGPETLEDIQRQYENKEMLIADLKSNRAPFRNDIVKKLKVYFML